MIRPTKGTRARVAAIALAALAALAGCADPPPAPRRGPPDVVLVVVDTLRRDRLGAYGHPRPTSPFLDRLAAEGALFEDVTAQCSWTKPSMVSLFHGRHLSTFRDALYPASPTIAELFADAGYRTVGVVGNILLDGRQGWARGFDHYDASTAADGRHARTIEELEAALEAPLARALEVDSSGTRPPLFLYLHPFDPHAPYAAHPRFDGALPPGGALAVAPEGWHRSELEREGRAAPRGGWDAELAEIHRQRGLYDQEVRHTDERLERIFERLHGLGVLERALVAVVSDHGEGLWDHRTPMRPEKRAQAPPRELFYQQHGATLYESAIATPLVLWGEGVPAGRRVALPVENVDLLPTLLALCGLDAPEGLDGASLVPLLDAEPAPAPRGAVFSHCLTSTSVRETATGWKLVVPTTAGARVEIAPELYHVPTDPLERDDRAAAEPEVVARLAGRIAAWREAHPTPSTLGAAPDAEEEQRLRDLGYVEGVHFDEAQGGDEPR